MKEGELSIPPAQSSHVRPGTATPPQGPSLPGLTHPRATRGLRRPVAAVPEEGGREQRQVSGQQAHGAAAGPVFRDGGSPGRRFLRTAREARAPSPPATTSGRWRPGPTPRAAAPRPAILRPSNPAGRGPRLPPARGGATRRRRCQGRGAGPPYLHFPPPGCVLPVMGRHLAC